MPTQYMRPTICPECPTGNREYDVFANDPMTRECGCADELAPLVIRKHIDTCTICSLYNRIVASDLVRTIPTMDSRCLKRYMGKWTPVRKHRRYVFLTLLNRWNRRVYTLTSHANTCPRCQEAAERERQEYAAQEHLYNFA